MNQNTTGKRSHLIAAKGGATFSQKRSGKQQVSSLHLAYGKLTLAQMAFALPAGTVPGKVEVKADGKGVDSRFEMEDDRIEIQLGEPLTLRAGQTLAVDIA